MEIEKSNKPFVLFYSLFFLFALCAPMSQSRVTDYIPVRSLMEMIRLGLAGITCIIAFKKKFTAKQWFFFAIFLGVALTSAFFSGQYNFLFISLFCFAVSQEDVSKVIKALGFGNLLGIVIVLLLTLIGLLPNEIVYQTGRIRNTLGFNLPVLISGWYLNVGMVYVYLNRYNFDLLGAMKILLPGVIIYYFTGGRASYFALLFVTLSCLAINKLSVKKIEYLAKKMPVMLKIVYLATFAISVFVAENYQNYSFLTDLNEITTGRLRWFWIFWNRYDPTFLGQPLNRVGSFQARNTGLPMSILDNASLSLILENGIILTIALTICIFYLFSLLKKNQDITSMVIWLVIFVTFLTGNTGLFFWRNPLLFQFAYLIDYSSKNKKIRSETL